MKKFILLFTIILIIVNNSFSLDPYDYDEAEVPYKSIPERKSSLPPLLKYDKRSIRYPDSLP